MHPCLHLRREVVASHAGGHTRLEFLRQGNGSVQCLLGVWAKVERNENMLHSHGDVLSRLSLLGPLASRFFQFLCQNGLSSVRLVERLVWVRCEGGRMAREDSLI